ncbi:MAG: DUF5343 domain-containing protein [Candidatus Bathyarchaeota archaeon]|nr:MAG: DUF5343 domain-containing protein [Candidatus Bathyarchaeota archaeon]
MAEIPYTNLAGKIPEYFDKFQEVGIPEKVNYKWLESIGFKSSNDRYIVKVLKHMNFIDDSGVPTERWQNLKNPPLVATIIADGIRDAYADLFNTYDDAYRKDREALYAYFSSTTGKAKSTVELMINTFTNLCALANFEEKIVHKKENNEKKPPKIGFSDVQINSGFVTPEVHINIQLHLPPTDNQDVYDSLFKSLRKHLFPGKD